MFISETVFGTKMLKLIFRYNNYYHLIALQS